MDFKDATPAQQKAITEKGNILVSAAAGSGKTATLTERIIRSILDDERPADIGRMLIERSKEIAKAHGYNGIYTIGQDNNLAACLFYINCGFNIGGVDTNVYKGTSQEGKSDIYFYLDCL